MGTERTVRREVVEESVEATPATAATPERVVEKRVVEERTVPEKPAVNNVNVNQDPASGNVNINTPDGTQVNINT